MGEGREKETLELVEGREKGSQITELFEANKEKGDLVEKVDTKKKTGEGYMAKIKREKEEASRKKDEEKASKMNALRENVRNQKKFQEKRKIEEERKIGEEE